MAKVTIVEQSGGLDRQRLAEECAKLDVSEETDLAEEFVTVAIETWPAY